MQKTKRLLAIEKIIRESRITTQEELLKRLKGKGISCTQATLSRNLRQLGVGRIPDGSGGYRYSLPDFPRPSTDSPVMLNIVPVIQDIIEAKGMLVIRTLPGNANNTALYIDNAGRYEIAGTIAGDDTILLIPRDGITSHQLHSCLEIVLPGLHSQLKKK
jgi:transcriptional regulator of arginine metabolism